MTEGSQGAGPEDLAHYGRVAEESLVGGWHFKSRRAAISACRDSGSAWATRSFVGDVGGRFGVLRRPTLGVSHELLDEQRVAGGAPGYRLPRLKQLVETPAD